MSTPLRTDEEQKVTGGASPSGGGMHPEWTNVRQNGRWSAYQHLLLARIKEMQREPEVIFWVFLFPLLLAVGLGIAFRTRPASIPNVVIAAGPGAESVLRMAQSAPQALHAQVVPEAVALNGFRLGRYDLVIIPKGPGDKGSSARNGVGGDTSGAGGEVEYRYDPARPESLMAREVADNVLQAAAGRKNPLRTSAQASSEPGARYIDFLIPGLLGMNLMNSGMWGVGFALVDYRQRKLLKRYVATPMRRSDFLLALTSSRLVLMVAELALLLGIGIFVFHMRVIGSWLGIVLLAALGSAAFAGLGLLTASRAQKIETVSGLINLVMMPMWVFSGVFFSYERFPAVVLPLIRALPLTALNDALRATILEGAPLAAQAGRLGVLLAWTTVSFVLALGWFRWT
jgi:ABC-type multidrug transport system permease subunit